MSCHYAFRLALLLVIVLCLQAPSGGTSWKKFAGCLRAKLGIRSLANRKVICAARRMAQQFRKMTYQCLNCDKYFHCQANYNAVSLCGKHPDARRAAEVISNCREFSQGGADRDSWKDQVANRHGRSLQSCRKYLCPVNCKYNPANGSCKKENC